MKKCVPLVVLPFLLACASAASSGLKIYVFDVGQGSSQLIVFPSGYSVLVDLPESTWSSSSMAASIAAKMEAILGRKTIDVAVASHLHMDHIASAGYGGIWALVNKYGFTINRLVDRNHGKWTDLNGDGKCNETEIQWYNIGEASNTAVKWVCFVTNPSGPFGKSRVIATVGSTTAISPPDLGAKVTIVAADAKDAVMKDGITPVSGDWRKHKCPPNENDYSIGFVVQYGAFRYATFGDLDGVYFDSYRICYNDEESTVGPRVGAPVDVYTVNHHGSDHSNTQKFLDTLRPSVSVISCGKGNSYGHPNLAVVDRLLRFGDVYVTERGNATKNYGAAVIANGDVIIEVDDATGRQYSVVAAGVTKRYSATGNATAVSTSDASVGLVSAWRLLSAIAVSVALAMAL